MKQHANKVMPDRPGLVDFAIGLVYSVLNLSTKQVDFFLEIQISRKTVISFDHKQYFIWKGGGGDAS